MIAAAGLTLEQSRALTTHLASLPGRCEHGAHHLQGCELCGVALKFKGQAQTTAAHSADRQRVDSAIRQLAATGREFSSNDARPLHNVVGPVVGAAFTAAARAGLIRRTGYEASTQPGTHAHPVATWKGIAA